MTVLRSSVPISNVPSFPTLPLRTLERLYSVDSPIPFSAQTRLQSLSVIRGLSEFQEA